MEDEQRQEAGHHDGSALGVLNDLGEGQGSVTAQPAGDEAQLFTDRYSLVQVDGLDARIRGPGKGSHRHPGQLLGGDGGHEPGQ